MTERRPSTFLPCDRRFSTRPGALAEELRCCEALADFNSVKSLLSHAHLSARPAFQFQAIEVRS